MAGSTARPPSARAVASAARARTRRWRGEERERQSNRKGDLVMNISEQPASECVPRSSASYTERGPNSPASIAIIGGGAVGTSMAHHVVDGLIRTGAPPVTVHLIERSSRAGPGIAYAS